jgi:hypothetical protein
LIGLLVLASRHIRGHYDGIHRALALHPLDLAAPRHPVVPAPVHVQAAGSIRVMHRAEDDESPDQIRHLAIVPIVRLDLSSLRALAYAASLGQPVLAVHISPDDDESARFKGYWAAWGDHVRLEVVDSPYRALVAPLARYIDALRQQRDEDDALRGVVIGHVPGTLYERVFACEPEGWSVDGNNGPSVTALVVRDSAQD